ELRPRRRIGCQILWPRCGPAGCHLQYLAQYFRGTAGGVLGSAQAGLLIRRKSAASSAISKLRLYVAPAPITTAPLFRPQSALQALLPSYGHTHPIPHSDENL